MMRIQWLVVMLMVPVIASLGGRSTFYNSDLTSKAMKSIVEMCYKNYVGSNPMVIIGDFHGLILKSVIESILIPIITIDSQSEYNEGGVNNKPFNSEPTIVIVMGDSPEQLEADLQLLQKINRWNSKAAYFILESSEKFCQNASTSLSVTWKMHIPSATYLCLNSTDTIVMYTFNPITNYAPEPWREITNQAKFNPDDPWTLYTQSFNSNNINCDSLNFDRMEYLNGYKIKALTAPKNNISFVPGKDYKQEGYNMIEYVGKTVFDTIITRLNATLVLQIDEIKVIHQYIANQSMDINIRFTLLHSKINRSYLYPYFQPEVMAFARTKKYLSTLHQISRLFSRSVLLLSFLTIIITFGVIACHKCQGFSFAFLETVRLLVSASIQSNFRGTPLRIFFTNILIFIVTTNGIFQGRLAAFLTKPEEGYNPRNAEDLKEFNYTLYTIDQNVEYLRAIFPDNHVVLVKQKECVDRALESYSGACIETKAKYLNDYWMKPIHIMYEPVYVNYYNHECRKDWPLKHRADNILTRIMESGLLRRWSFHTISTVLNKKRIVDIERIASKYSPVELKALDFSFALLTTGLIMATIVFIMELIIKKKMTVRNKEKKNADGWVETRN